MKKLIAVLFLMFIASCSRMSSENPIIIQAKDFDPSSVNVWSSPHFNGLVTNNSDNDQQVDIVIYKFDAEDRNYLFDIAYAAAESRPVEIYLNDEKIAMNALSGITGGWKTIETTSVGVVKLKKSNNCLRIIKIRGGIPHLQSLIFRFTDSPTPVSTSNDKK